VDRLAGRTEATDVRVASGDPAITVRMTPEPPEATDVRGRFGGLGDHREDDTRALRQQVAGHGCNLSRPLRSPARIPQLNGRGPDSLRILERCALGETPAWFCG
jgi:hypothetical protein